MFKSPIFFCYCWFECFFGTSFTVLCWGLWYNAEAKLKGRLQLDKTFHDVHWSGRSAADGDGQSLRKRPVHIQGHSRVRGKAQRMFVFFTKNVYAVNIFFGMKQNNLWANPVGMRSMPCIYSMHSLYSRSRSITTAGSTCHKSINIHIFTFGKLYNTHGQKQHQLRRKERFHERNDATGTSHQCVSVLSTLCKQMGQ